MEQREEICANCEHLEQENYQPTYGECRAKSPVRHGRESQAQWPVVSVNDWCGEYQPKPEEEEV